MWQSFTPVVVAAGLVTLLVAGPVAHAADGPPPVLKAMRALTTPVVPLTAAQLDQVRGHGGFDALAALLAACGGGCTANVQHVTQYSNTPNSSNVSVIEQRSGGQ
jgi:hypothetical protein